MKIGVCFKIVFVLTGNCDDGQDPEEYVKIAAVSTGQIFDLFKNDVHQVNLIHLNMSDCVENGFYSLFNYSRYWNSFVCLCDLIK